MIYKCNPPSESEFRRFIFEAFWFNSSIVDISYELLSRYNKSSRLINKNPTMLHNIDVMFSQRPLFYFLISPAVTLWKFTKVKWMTSQPITEPIVPIFAIVLCDLFLVITIIFKRCDRFNILRTFSKWC